MTVLDRSPESRAMVMRLPDGAFWFFIALECVLIALSFFPIQLSHYQEGIIVIGGSLLVGIALLYGLVLLGRKYQWDWSKWD
jgi:hypothetical protein